MNLEWAIAIFSVCMPMTAGIVWATVKARVTNGNGNGNGMKYVTTREFDNLCERIGRIEDDIKEILQRI
jgi:hypothetical protein